MNGRFCSRSTSMQHEWAIQFMWSQQRACEGKTTVPVRGAGRGRLLQLRRNGMVCTVHQKVEDINTFFAIAEEEKHHQHLNLKANKNAETASRLLSRHRRSRTQFCKQPCDDGDDIKLKMS
ncbi:unnamed protein product [Dovyalis caffra]|uniref:Uncharacterized protein n=1 Tax=Dovyalis caffra TaxID=77055 RepID=A0AAV1QWR7_9ROSI|nr:unnamed protein product [Dovyalis caffra]